MTLKALSPGDLTIDEFQRPDLLYKIIIIGDSGVGKSNLIDRYTTDTFRETTRPTIGVEFGHRSLRIDDKLVREG